jgi:hypothetical protein
MVKGECGVNIVDVVQEVEEVQVILLGDPCAVVTESATKTWSHWTPDKSFFLPLLNALDLLDLLFLWVTSISEQKFSKVCLGDVSFLVGILALKLERQNFTLQLMLKVQELFNLELLIELLSEEVAAQCTVDTLKVSQKSLAKGSQQNCVQSRQPLQPHR